MAEIRTNPGYFDLPAVEGVNYPARYRLKKFRHEGVKNA